MSDENSPETRTDARADEYSRTIREYSRTIRGDGDGTTRWGDEIDPAYVLAALLVTLEERRILTREDSARIVNGAPSPSPPDARDWNAQPATAREVVVATRTDRPTSTEPDAPDESLFQRVIGRIDAAMDGAALTPGEVKWCKAMLKELQLRSESKDRTIDRLTMERDAANEESEKLGKQLTAYKNCGVCGRVVDTREEDEGGDNYGIKLIEGGWICSAKCYDVHASRRRSGDRPDEGRRQA